MSVYDEDLTTKEIIGSFEFDINQILDKHRFNTWQYVHIYGAPLGVSGKFTDTMNANAEIGSLWKGKILLKVDYDNEASAPKTIVAPTDNNLVVDAYNYVKNQKRAWIIEVSIIEALFLPDNKKYKIKVCCENNLVSTAEIV